jgi:uncharacterized protein (DUF1697 family)
MASTQIAFIRGINVGRAKRVAMADLRKLVADLGYGNVRTLLNSGNIVFTTSRATSGDAAARIEKAMAKTLGVSARVFMLSAEDLSAAIAANPLAKVASDPSRFLVAVLENPADLKRLKPLTKQDWDGEALAIGQRVAYLWCPEGILASELLVEVMGLLGDAATTRNWATMLKLAALAEKPV